MRIGNSSKVADEGVAPIKQGVKTATSSLLWAYQAAHKPLPEAGSLSIVIDGRGDPMCVVEAVSVEVKRVADVDAAFARNYGEWDRTLEGQRAHCWTFDVERCRTIGKAPAPEMPLIYERFRAVHP